MDSQLDLFDDKPDDPPRAPKLPDGFRYGAELISAEQERELVQVLQALPLREFEFHGYTGRRRVISYGWHYDFAARSLTRAFDMPEFLRRLRIVAADFAGLPAESLQHVLVSEYSAGAAIGWHRDKAVFGDVIGISLNAACVFRLRRAEAGRWNRINITAEPRSAYLLSGEARTVWEHSIPPVRELRYSITYRNLREDR